MGTVGPRSRKRVVGDFSETCSMDQTQARKGSSFKIVLSNILTPFPPLNGDGVAALCTCITTLLPLLPTLLPFAMCLLWRRAKRLSAAM